MTIISWSQMAKWSLAHIRLKRQFGSAILVTRSQSSKMVQTPRRRRCLAMCREWWRWTKISTRSLSSKRPVDSFSTNSQIGCNKERNSRKRNWRRAGRAQQAIWIYMKSKTNASSSFPLQLLKFNHPLQNTKVKIPVYPMTSDVIAPWRPKMKPPEKRSTPQNQLPSLKRFHLLLVVSSPGWSGR